MDDLCADFGDVVGVAVLSNWHARDAGVVANRHDVSVHLPEWMTCVAELVEAPIQRFDTELGDSGFRIERVEPLPGWHEAVAYRESDGTLCVPDVLTTLPGSTVGSERIALSIVHRFRPPHSVFTKYDPERILVGHGTGIFENAAGELENAISYARRRLPRALLSHGPTQVRMMLGAVRD